MLSKNRIKEIQSLQIKKFRDAKRLFLAEGVKTVLELVDQAPDALEEVFATSDFLEKRSADLKKVNIEFTEVSEEELKKISLQSSPNGVLAVCHYFNQPSDHFDFETHFSLYLDDIRDPGNFGTIIRLADWFGISTLFCSPGSCDLYNPKVIQSTMGAFLRVNCVYVELKELLETRKIRNVYGAVLNGNNLYKEELESGLIVIGNEANGISEQNLELITKRLTIPANQSNGTESLNAAMATSIIVSEFFRQLKIS
jgi:TrmH family RNA methyltransferase